MGIQTLMQVNTTKNRIKTQIKTPSKYAQIIGKQSHTHTQTVVIDPVSGQSNQVKTIEKIFGFFLLYSVTDTIRLLCALLLACVFVCANEM